MPADQPPARAERTPDALYGMMARRLGRRPDEKTDGALLERWVREFLADLARMKLLTPGACLPMCAVAVKRLTDLGVRAVFQAGTASFRRISREAAAADPHEADNELFSYLFGLDKDGRNYDHAAALDTMLTRRLPEGHCWVALPDDGLILDPSAPLIPTHCERSTGKPWQYHVPYVMFDAATLLGTDSVFLLPDVAATLSFPIYLLEEVLRTKPAIVAEAGREGYDELLAAAKHLKDAAGTPPAVCVDDLRPGGRARGVIDALVAAERRHREAAAADSGRAAADEARLNAPHPIPRETP